MKKILKNFSFLIFPVLIILFFLFSYNIIKLEYQFAFQSAHVYQNPYPWQKYLLLSEGKEFLKKINEKKNINNLSKVKIYIEEQSLQKLKGDLPGSTKLWQNAFVDYPDHNIFMKKIKIRYRGDNPSNWLKIKKTFKIKTNKNTSINGFRNLDYHIYNAETFFPYIILNKMNLLNQKIKLVEVYINDGSHGLYYELETMDESFLRKNNIMPVNIYKGENTGNEFYIGLNRNLFNNPGLWSKEANFNDLQEEEDLKKFLITLKSNKHLSDETLNDYIDLDYFSRLEALLVITGNYHHDFYHNIRLIIDPWNGKATQLIADPMISTIEDLKLDFGANDLSDFLNKNTTFVHNKYNYLYYFLTKEDVVEDLYNYFFKIQTELLSIQKKEPYDPLYPNHIKDSKNNLDTLNQNKKIILNQLNSNPVSSWNKKKIGFDIVVNDFTPLSNLKLKFNENHPNWVGIDLNYDQKISEEEPKFYFNKKLNTINIPIILYSNRYKKNNNNDSMSSYKLDYSKTYFQFLTDNNTSPEHIESSNFFNKKTFTIKLMANEHNAVKKNLSNNLIYLRGETSNKTKILSGNIIVKEDQVFNEKIIIEPNTKFFIGPKKNIIFKNQVTMKGSEENPIIFDKFDEVSEPWGTVALIGQKSNDSKIDNVKMRNGSGGNFNQYKFTSMLSLHNVKNVKILNSEFSQNQNFDDTVHIVYCDNIFLKNLVLNDAFGDAIDIDMSKNIILEDIKIKYPNNDGVDFMSTNASIVNLEVTGSKDKAISVGENSEIKIFKSKFVKNEIGVAVKDKSKAYIHNSDFLDNNYQIAAYAKNWRYGQGGFTKVYESNFLSDENKFITSQDPAEIGKKKNKDLNQNSKIELFNSKISKARKIYGTNFFEN